MTRPIPPIIPAQALRSNPETFNENAELTIAYLFEDMPTYHSEMATYLEGRVDEVAGATTAAADSISARDTALSAEAGASAHAATATTARNQAEAFETLADAHRVDAEAARDAAQAAAANAEGVPIGSILPFASATVPTGYLLCDGASFDAAAYPTLNTVLGGNTLPDLRGLFLRGLDPTGAVDPDGATRVLLDSQADALASHTHSYVARQGNVNRGSGSTTVTTAANSTRTTGATGGDETRPKNVAVNFIVKAA